MSSFVACKDYDEDSYDELRALITKNDKSLRDIIDQQKQDLLNAIEQAKCKCNPANYASAEEFRKAQARLDSIADVLKNMPGPGEKYNDQWIKDSLASISDTINELNYWIVYVRELAKSDSVRIDSIANAIYGWNDQIDSLISNVNAIWIALSKIQGGCGCDTALINQKIASAQATADSAKNIAGEAMKKALKALDLAENDSVRIDGLEIRMDSLEKKFNEIIIRDFSKEIDSLSAVTDSLATELDKVKADIQKMVTGILIQGTESPVIGYFNTPFDARALVLAAYYGELESPLEFPATEAKNYVNGDSDFAKWTERNLQIIGNLSSVRGYIAHQPTGIFVSTNNGKEFGNAGTLYLTVNPNTVDFSGKKIALETSTAKESFIELSSLTHSTRELTFGFTRAANNGFYEAQATLAKQNIDKVKMRIDFRELEDCAKDLIKQKNKSSVLNMAAALVNSFQDVLPAYGVKASWQDASTNTKHDVFSEYALANTAIKPLSYAFLKGMNEELPYEDKIINEIDETVDELQSLPVEDRDNLKSRLNSYVTRLYNKLNSIFNKAPNLALQPCMIAIANNKAVMLAQSLKKPTKAASKAIELYPTSYSLELLAPAYRKFVAITDVFNASDKSPVDLSTAKQLAKEANMGDNLKRVFDQETVCKFTGQAGYIYEITYTAVDYHGKVAIKKFYVEF
jgi:hypothetical protein